MEFWLVLVLTLVVPLDTNITGSTTVLPTHTSVTSVTSEQLPTAAASMIPPAPFNTPTSTISGHTTTTDSTSTGDRTTITETTEAGPAISDWTTITETTEAGPAISDWTTITETTEAGPAISDWTTIIETTEAGPTTAATSGYTTITDSTSSSDWTTITKTTEAGPTTLATSPPNSTTSGQPTTTGSNSTSDRTTFYPITTTAEADPTTADTSGHTTITDSTSSSDWTTITETTEAGPTTNDWTTITETTEAGPTPSDWTTITETTEAGPTTNDWTTITETTEAGPTTNDWTTITGSTEAGPTTNDWTTITETTEAGPTPSDWTTITETTEAGPTLNDWTTITETTEEGPTLNDWTTITETTEAGPTTSDWTAITKTTEAGPSTPAPPPPYSTTSGQPTTTDSNSTSNRTTFYPINTTTEADPTTAATSGHTTITDSTSSSDWTTTTETTGAGPTTSDWTTITETNEASPTPSDWTTITETTEADPTNPSDWTTITETTEAGPTTSDWTTITETTEADPTTAATYGHPTTTDSNSTSDWTTIIETTEARPTTAASTPAPPLTTTHAPTTTTTTPPPLVCDNGGISLNGVCICPDEWTGKNCSQENFCRAQQLGGFNFPRTPIGWFAYSKEVCPTGTSGAGKSEASTRCSSINGSPSFEPNVQHLQCDQTLSDIHQNLTSPADLESLAGSTQILTSQPEELTAENVTTAAQIVDRLLRSPNATESVRVAAVATVSQLLSAPDVSEENNTTVGLTETLDELSVNLTLGLNTSQSQVVQPNLVVQSAQIPAAGTQGVQFTSLSGTSGSFVADRIELNTNTSTVVVENGFIADALIYVRFPAEAAGVRQRPSNISLGFVLYQNDRFFRSRRYKRQRATIRVLSATVGGQDHSLMPDHVEIMFRPTMLNGTSLYDFACVFWNYDVSDWSTDGCSKGNASDGLLRCFCNHTTNFAALWTYREKYDYAEALDWISIVGLSFSILCLVVTISHHIKENFHNNSTEETNNMNSKMAQLCIYVSLLAFIITFLSGVHNSSRQNDAPVEVDDANNIIPDSDERVEPDRGSCTAVAALLHFFLLATFMWNSVYGTLMVLLFWTDSELPPYWSKVSHAVGWGLPAVVMAITLGATYRVDSPLGYRQEEFCWLAALDKNQQFNFGKPMFWAFLLPVGLILIYNIVMLVLTTWRTNKKLKSTNPSSLRKMFLISFSLAVLLGVSWTLGYLVLVTSGTANLVFSIIFCLCTTTQGFQIFILFTARTPSFRASVSRPVRYISSINMHLNSRSYSLTKTLWSTTGSESYRDLKDQQESEI